MIPVILDGSTNKRIIDGLLDTGADRTVFPARQAQAVGVSLPTSIDGTFQTAGGVSIPYRLADVVLELRSSGTSVRWKSTIAFADSPLGLVHLGVRGFLEYFHATFQGPEQKLRLLATALRIFRQAIALKLRAIHCTAPNECVPRTRPTTCSAN